VIYAFETNSGQMPQAIKSLGKEAGAKNETNEDIRSLT
jgi:hypothetical protein